MSTYFTSDLHFSHKGICKARGMTIEENAEWLEILLNLDRQPVGVKFFHSKEEYDDFDAPENEHIRPYCIVVRRASEGINQKVCQRHSVNCPHRGNRISFYARNLHKSVNRVTGQPQMMLDCDFRRILNLVNSHSEKFCKCSSGHCAGCSDFCLTATFRTTY